jgi:hypothetical protein
LTSPLRREWRPKFDVGTFRLSAHRDALKLEKLPLAVGSGLPPVGDVDLSGQDEDNQCLSRFVLHPRRLPGGATLTNWSPGDPQLLFPAAEGHQGAASDTYYASGILRGESSGRRYAFLTIFAKNEDIFHLLSADLHVLALFDLDVGTYDTGSRFDLPPRRQRNLERINVTRGRLEVSYTSNRRVSLMRGRTDGGGGFHPFAYEFDLSAEARSGTEMALRLCADALKPPQAVGALFTVAGSPFTARLTPTPTSRSWGMPGRCAGGKRKRPFPGGSAGSIVSGSRNMPAATPACWPTVSDINGRRSPLTMVGSSACGGSFGGGSMTGR